MVDCIWNVTAHVQKPDFVFRRNGRVHLNRQRSQVSLLLAAEVCASAVVMLDTQFSEVVWTVLATNSIRQFPLHFLSRASPCAIIFQLHSIRDSYTTTGYLGAFAQQLSKAAINLVISIHPSVRPSSQNSATPARRIFLNFHYLTCLLKFVYMRKLLLIFDKNK